MPHAPIRQRIASGAAHLALAVLPMLMLVSALCAAQQVNSNSTDALAQLAWGEVVDGLQLHISIGVNTEKLAESTSLLGLSVTLRLVTP